MTSNTDFTTRPTLLEADEDMQLNIDDAEGLNVCNDKGWNIVEADGMNIDDAKGLCIDMARGLDINEAEGLMNIQTWHLAGMPDKAMQQDTITYSAAGMLATWMATGCLLLASWLRCGTGLCSRLRNLAYHQ